MRKILLILLVGFLLAGCVKRASVREERISGLSSPASKFCVQQGGEIVIVKHKRVEGSFCKIDGKFIDEWEFFKRARKVK